MPVSSAQMRSQLFGRFATFFALTLWLERPISPTHTHLCRQVNELVTQNHDIFLQAVCEGREYKSTTLPSPIRQRLRHVDAPSLVLFFINYMQNLN